MKKRTRKVIFDAHSWLGVVSALILFVVCFTGVVSLFRYEIGSWENPGLRTDESRNIQNKLSIDAAMNIAFEKHNVRRDEFFVNLPGERYGERYRFLYIEGEGKQRKAKQVFLDAFTGEELHQSKSGIVDLLISMHTDLKLPRPFGRYLVGLLGVLMMFSIISGVIAHRHYLKEFFQFRPNKNHKLTMTDMHKVMGAWGILFQLVLAFTGAILGLIGLFQLFMAVAAYKGDTNAAFEGFLGPHIEAIGEPAKMHNIEELIKKAEEKWDGYNVERLKFHAYGDKVARITINGNMQANLAGSQAVTYDGVTGEETFVSDFMDMGAGARIYGASFILHYALYGGFIIKILYMLLGVAMTLMTTTGLMMWMAKRTNRNRSYNKLSSLNIGVSFGLIIATATIFSANKLLPEVENKSQLEMLTYFLVWIIIIVWSFIRKDRYKLVKELFILSGLIYLLVPIVNALVTGDHLINSYQQGYYTVFGVDLIFLITALLLLFTAVKWPRSKTIKTEK